MLMSLKTICDASAVDRAKQLLQVDHKLEERELEEIEELFVGLSSIQYLAVLSDPDNQCGLRIYEAWVHKRSFPVLLFFGSLWCVSVLMGLMLISGR